MRRWNPRSPWLVTVFLLVVLALIASACGGGSDSSDTTVLSGTPDPTIAAEGGGDAVGDTGSSSPETARAAPVAALVSNTGRDIVFTADLTIAVTDVAVASDTATQEIDALGGIVFGQRTTGAPNPVSILTFKVRPNDFQSALDRLGAIGEVRSQNISADDVTEKIVDLQSRILSAQASVDRLRELMGSAEGVQVVVQVETELLARETQLETLRGQLRTLEDHVSLATIVLTLTEALSQPGLDLAVSAYSGHDGLGQSCHGNTDLAIDEGSDVTVCFEIINAGDSPLTNFELNDPVLDVSLDDLIVVFGDPSRTIEPGETIMLAAEIVAERDLRTQTRVSAVPVNQDGQAVTGRNVASTSTIFVNAVDPGGVPSFGEGLSASLGFLANAGRVLILSLGVALPFLWIIPVLILISWRLRRRSSDNELATAE